MNCLIVAAGQGARLREKLELKPLIPVREVPLIQHVMDRARQAGVDRFTVVSGYRGDELRRHLDDTASRQGTPVTHVVNDDWDRANGVSVLKAEPFLDGPFLLAMCDHVVDPGIFRRLMALQPPPDGVVLAVDFNIDDQLNDPDDVTRVKSRDGRIERIGKLLPEFDCYDTGVFLCTPVMFDALRESQAGCDDSISGAMNVLSRWNKAYILDIGDRLWIDVDDAVALAKAEELLGSGRL